MHEHREGHMDAPKYYYSNGLEYTREDYYVKNLRRMNRVKLWMTIGLIFGTCLSAVIWLVNSCAQILRILSLFVVVSIGQSVGAEISGEMINNVIGNIWVFLLFIFPIAIFIMSFKGYYHMDKRMFNSLIYIFLGFLFAAAVALIGTGSPLCVFFIIYSIAGMMLNWQCRRCIGELEELSHYDGFPHFSALIDCKSASKYYRAVATRFTPTAKEGKAKETEAEEQEQKKKPKVFTPTNEYYAEKLVEKGESGQMDSIPFSGIAEEEAN